MPLPPCLQRIDLHLALPEGPAPTAKGVQPALDYLLHALGSTCRVMRFHFAGERAARFLELFHASDWKHLGSHFRSRSLVILAVSVGRSSFVDATLADESRASIEDAFPWLEKHHRESLYDTMDKPLTSGKSIL